MSQLRRQKYLNMNKTKAKKEANLWLTPYIRYCLTDCCDSMNESEIHESRFNALVDDTVSINKFVEEFLYKEYVKTVADIYHENSLDIEDLESPVTELPISYSEIKKELEPLLNQPF
jgi:hypothetical protein